LDPAAPLALWLYAASKGGVGSTPHLFWLCERDHPCMWIWWTRRPNHRTLSDFRAEHGDNLDELLS
jgi:hypothetical protein